MKINKKKTQTILTVMILLLIMTGCRKNKKVSDEDISSENESNVQENVTEEQEENSEESGVTILENEGEIEIEISEDMDSDGF